MQDFWGSDYGTVLLLLFSCSVVSDSFVTPWTVARQAPLSMEFSRQEYWSGLPFPSPENLPPATLDVIWRSVQFSHSVVSDSLQPHGFLSVTNFQSLLKLMSIKSVMPSNHLILCLSSPPAFNLSQHQGLCQWVSSSNQVAKVLELHLQH